MPVEALKVPPTPATVKLVLARMVAVPLRLPLKVIAQEPRPLAIVQVLAPPAKVAATVSVTRLKVTTVPFGAGERVLPLVTWTVAVIVCGEPTALVALGGSSVMSASSHTLVAGPLLGATPLVSRWT